MIKLNDIKSILLLTCLKDAMLKKVVEITWETEYRAGEYVFREGDYAERRYAIIVGKVGLEIARNSSDQILVDTALKGRTFGFSALIDTEEKKYTSSAKAMTDTKVIFWRAADLEELFHQDYELGFVFIKKNC